MAISGILYTNPQRYTQVHMQLLSMQKISTLRVQADVSELATIRDFVELQTGALGVAPDAMYDLVLATNEIATNIVVHGYRGQP